MHQRSSNAGIGKALGPTLRPTRCSTLRLTLGCAILIGGPAFGQATSNTAAASSATTEVDEEIVVTGRSLGEFRAQIRLAQEAVFNKFNEINSDDAFDIHCRQVAPTGIRIRRRICEPDFWREAQQKAGSEMARAMQGGAAIAPSIYLADARHQGEIMVEEMWRLASENQEFKRTLASLGTLDEGYQATHPVGISTATYMSPGLFGEDGLPYGAALVARVRIGHGPWRHRLTQRTFAFSRLDGEIGTLGLKCRGEKDQLPYESGSEWSLPEDWTSCKLRVDAEPGTTFSFYEFE